MSPDTTRVRGAVPALLLALLASALFFAGLGAVGLFDADEPAYAQAAREMLARGDWVTPTFNGAPRFDKPVLFYWLIMLSYSLFGVGELAVRCWSALAATALVLLTAWGARRFLGPPADRWAGLALATCLLTAVLARAAVTDMLLAIFVATAILAGVAAWEAQSHGAQRTAHSAGGSAESARGWALLAWAAMALAVLVKGPIGLVIPGFTFGAGLWVAREFRDGLRRLVPWEGPLLFLALALPWYLLVLSANGWAFIEGFILKHHVTRFTGVVSSHAGPLWYYLPVLLVGFFPWSGYLPATGWRAWQILRRRKPEGCGDRLIIACTCWAVGVFILFSLAGTKLPSYLYPAFPALSLLVAGLGIDKAKPTTDNGQVAADNRQVQTENGQPRTDKLQPTISDRVIDPTPDRLSVVGFVPRSAGSVPPAPRWLCLLAPWLTGVVGCALAVGFALVPWIFDWARPAARGVLDGVEAPTGLALGMAGLLAVGTTAGLVASGWRRPAILAAMMAGLILAGGLLAVPRAHGVLQGALAEFSADAHRLVPPGGTVVVYGLNAPTIVFYSERRVLPLGPGAPDSVDRIQRLLAEGRPIVVISRSAHAPILDRIPGLVRGKARNGYAIYWPDRRQAAGLK